ncbi:MAG: hypothetical protein PHU23_15675 [Dehalococcoidales bacterium]|nr:hypothetical protein [Dehalococcoidales bacterium]
MGTTSDDLIIVPAGIYLAIKMIPEGVFTECREKAGIERIDSKTKWIMAGIVVLIWLLIVFLIVRFIWQIFS